MKKLEKLREKIADIDIEMVDLLKKLYESSDTKDKKRIYKEVVYKVSERSSYAVHIGFQKYLEGLPVYNGEIEKEKLHRIGDYSKKIGLDPEEPKKLLEYLMEVSRTIQIFIHDYLNCCLEDVNNPRSQKIKIKS